MFCHPFFWRFSAVRIFLWNRVRTKELTLRLSLCLPDWSNLEPTYYITYELDKHYLQFEYSLFPNTAVFTLIFLRLVFWYKRGVMFRAALPSIQHEQQREVLSPFPTDTMFEARKKSQPAFSQGMSSSLDALCWPFHPNHNHRSRRAQGKRSKSKIPKPPLFFGLHEDVH